MNDENSSRFTREKKRFYNCVRHYIVVSYRKYFAALTVYATMMFIFVIYAVIISTFVAPSWATILCNILGLLLFGAALISIGTFI